jgi:hypothetical protein
MNEMTAPTATLASDARTVLVGLSRDQLKEAVAALGEKPFRAKQLWPWIYHRGARACLEDAARREDRGRVLAGQVLRMILVRHGAKAAGDLRTEEEVLGAALEADDREATERDRARLLDLGRAELARRRHLHARRVVHEATELELRGGVEATGARDTDAQARDFFRHEMTLRLNVNGSAQYVDSATLYFGWRLVGD